MRRNVGYVLEAGSDDWAKAMQDTVVAIMIEKKAAMDNLDEILSVRGVDMVQFGPADYSVSIGKPGFKQSPEVLKIQRDMIELAIKRGVAPRVEIVSFEQAKPFVELGVRHFCIGWDVRVIFNWCQEQSKAMRNLLGN